MKILYRTSKIIDVFCDDDETEKHGWGKWSKFLLGHNNRLIFLDGRPLTGQEFLELTESVHAN